MNDLLAGALLRSGQDRAEHDGVGTGHDCLGYIAGVADTAVCDDGDRAFEGLLCGIDGGDLRNPYATDDTRCADGAGANADLDCMSSGITECDGAVGCANVASNHIDVRVLLRNPGRHVHHALGVAVRAVDYDYVHAFVGQGFHAAFVAGTDSGAYAQAVF